MAVLEEKVEELLKTVRKVEAYQEVQNVVSKFWHLFEMGKYEERYKLIASKTEGVTVEIGARGVFEGAESAYRSLVVTEQGFVKSHAAGMKKLFPDVDFPDDHSGMLESTLIGSPLIEVAGDCKTAKGVFIYLQSIGKTHENDPQPRSMWIWWKSAVDFVREDDGWKIWHFNSNPYYATGSTEDWVQNSIKMMNMGMPGSGDQMRKGNKQGGPSHFTHADRPTTSFYRSYRIDALPLEIRLPEPYETFDETFSYEPEKAE